MILRAAMTVVLPLCAATVAQATVMELPWPASSLAVQRVAGTSHFLATGPFIDGPLEGMTVEGVLHQQSWRVAGELTTLQLLAPLRRQLAGAGFETLFQCETDVCGGFDFRFQIDILPEPDMHVNLGDYRYLSAKRIADGEDEEYISVIVSRSANAGFVHLTRIGPDDETVDIEGAWSSDTLAADAIDVGERLELAGHVSLDDLAFRTGSSRLGDGPFASLADLALYLNARPDRTVTLVGHTDAVGALDSNIELSRMRAAAVLERLVRRHGVSRGQISSDGVGFLAPRASNLTEDGRARNRRVEAVLVSTE